MGRAADRKRVDGTRVAVTVTVVRLDAAVTGRPHVDDALAAATLAYRAGTMDVVGGGVVACFGRQQLTPTCL